MKDLVKKRQGSRHRNNERYTSMKEKSKIWPVWEIRELVKNLKSKKGLKRKMIDISTQSVGNS